MVSLLRSFHACNHIWSWQFRADHNRFEPLYCTVLCFFYPTGSPVPSLAKKCSINQVYLELLLLIVDWSKMCSLRQFDYGARWPSLMVIGTLSSCTNDVATYPCQSCGYKSVRDCITANSKASPLFGDLQLCTPGRCSLKNSAELTIQQQHNNGSTGDVLPSLTIKNSILKITWAVDHSSTAKAAITTWLCSQQYMQDLLSVASGSRLNAICQEVCISTGLHRWKDKDCSNRNKYIF